MNSATQLTLLQSISPEACQIVLTRGSVSVPMTAIRGSGRGEMIGSNGVQQTYHVTDWLVTTTQTGSLGKPKRGDTIVCGEANYTVSHPDEGHAVVEYHGNDETAYRIHSVKNGY